MPLEDVDYLLENSEKDSVMLFIDSGTRKKEYHPNAASYVVELTEPIKNVYGIEILDASIPVTTYNVDRHNNMFAYTQVFFAQGYTSSDFVIYFQELQDCAIFNTLFAEKRATEILICNELSPGALVFDQMAQDETRDVETSSPFLFLKRCVATDTGISVIDLSFEQAGDVPNKFVFRYEGKVYLIESASPLIEIITNKEFTVMEDGTLVYYEQILISSQELVQLIPTMKNETDHAVDMYINNNYIAIETGNYDSLSLMQYLGNIGKLVAREKYSSLLTQSHLYPRPSNAFGDIDKQMRFKFLYSGVQPFIFDMKKSTCGEPIGFAAVADPMHGSYFALPHRSNNQLFMSLPVPNPNDALNPILQTIRAPNIINLMGIRYLLLRCPEIENHLLGSFAFGNFSPGLGMFKLASGMDITNLRFDFITSIKKPFHPIGKLPRLTLRFETKNGDLYDFKGIDHNMLICIKYYAPKQQSRMTRSILNPNYNPNFLDYTVNRLYLENKSIDNDENNETDDEEEFKSFLNQQRQYAYDSEEET